MLALDIKQHWIPLNDRIIIITETGWAAPTTNTLESHRKWTPSRVSTLADPTSLEHSTRTQKTCLSQFLYALGLFSSSVISKELFWPCVTPRPTMRIRQDAELWIDPWGERKGAEGILLVSAQNSAMGGCGLQVHLVSANVQASIAWERRQTWRHIQVLKDARWVSI